ncbi:TonB-dependent receptor [Comamonas serinivorans]|uniref:TonB-dependent receptor n=1 Tax=Comamonas serinivorans TaxID=1082851 RepID=A0A1Y0EJI4_9BURK|nr:TonB-dependent receptor [Comamonas serinivorans]ARU03795.1 TonB-dependent receptor [Comamonas serinivorans]
MHPAAASRPSRTQAAALAAALSSGFACAQEASNATLEEVVITASGFEQELKQAPASIAVITRQQLETTPYRDLAEALQSVEGVDVRGSTGKTGGLDISIRGMPSDYTLVLIDGRRQNVAGDVTPNGFGAALNSLLPPMSAIERIEVIRGPMSTLYGSDAMGGVVNIITRKVAKTWGGSASVQFGVPEHSGESSQQKLNFYLSGPIVQDTLGLAIRGNVANRGDSDRIWEGVGRDARPAKSRQHTLGAKLSFTPHRDHQFWLDGESGHTWYDNSDCRLGNVDYVNCTTGAPATAVPGYRDHMRFNREQFSLGHNSRFAFGRLESSVMRSTTETLGRTIPSAAVPVGDPSVGQHRQLKTVNTVVDTKLVSPIGDAHVLTTGAQWWDASFKDGLLPGKYGQKMWAVFAEDEWRLAESVTATFGARYNRHETFGGEFSPRAYAVWNASPTLTVKGGVSRGFRAPRLNQLIDGASGVTGQGTVISIGNPTLKPETSTSTELGVLYDNQAGWTSSATLFHNKIKNRISSGGNCGTVWISSCAANPTADYAVNIDEGKTWGLELGTRVPLSKDLTLNLNYTWTDSEAVVDGIKSGKLSDTAKHVANLQLNWAVNERANVWLRGEYRGKSRRFDGDPGALTGNSRLEQQALGDLKGYALFHLGGGYKVSRNATINASIYNLFDKDFSGYRTWINTAGETVVGSPYYRTAQSVKGTAPSGRTLWVSANFEF